MRQRHTVLFALLVALAPRPARSDTWPAGVPTEALLAESHRSVKALGIYRAIVVKTERVHGKVLGPEVADTWVREQPRAVRMTFIVNGRPGRRVLYNEQVRAGEMLVREKGVLGFMSLWVAIDGWLVHRSTNHSVRQVGFGPLLDLIDRDLAQARRFGGHRRTDESPGQGPGGTSCLVFTAPGGAPVYAARTRLCFDASSRLPVVVEVFDRAGFLERYEWRNVLPRQSVDAAFFTAKGAGF
jgi:hypothetical protein